MTEKVTELKIKVEDRVKRQDRAGCLGTVVALREEVVGSSGQASHKEVLVKVQWDNGTVSYFSPESLVAA